jgi:hypothetical protein
MIQHINVIILKNKRKHEIYRVDKFRTIKEYMVKLSVIVFIHDI